MIMMCDLSRAKHRTNTRPQGVVCVGEIAPRQDPNSGKGLRMKE